ncbi:MAG: flagellar hook assembly protein FlgD [Spirochaetales bacterium]|nr:flagellar hook assembly protein FlgD [Spirochaetales bacterium]
MDGISNTFSLNTTQSTAEKFRTKMAADAVNNGLKKDGREVVKTMGKDEFLKLLITQLQHQDPTNPMEDREFIAQMAQFSSLEQMLTMNNNMEKVLSNMSFSSSYDLLGRNVTIDTNELGQDGEMKVIEGMVESVSRNGNESYIRVGGSDYPMSQILSVQN